MTHDMTDVGRRTPIRRRLVAGVAVVATLSAAGVVGAAVGVQTEGSGGGKAKMSCPGGMTRLGHEFGEEMSIFPYDPAIHISNLYTTDDDYFQVEDIDMGAHAGTHLDAPGHFIGPIPEDPDAERGRYVDELRADEFVWPAYKIDVRGRSFTDNFVEVSDIEAYEDEHGEIQEGSLVILQTGAEAYFGLDGEGDERIVEDGLAVNVDDMFTFENAGFSGAAVQWLFDERGIDAVGSDAYGPDAFGDDLFDATYTTLANDGVALVAIANLDSVSVRKDIIFASTVALADGSGFSTDPIACHGKKK